MSLIEVPQKTIIRPNPGRQTQALACQADILIYGGAAGSGKSHFLFLEASRSINIPGYVCSYFRRTYSDITVDGGAWQKSQLFFPGLEGIPNHSTLSYLFPSGARIGFANLEHEWSVSKYQSAEIAKLLFDELIQFYKSQFFYMQSRNRTTCGVRPITRAACNPDPDSWVKQFILWWLDEEGRFPDRSKAGVIRWMVNDLQSDNIVWWDQEPELFKEILAHNRKEDPDYKPLSVSFIPASVDDNPYMLRAGYKSTLLNLSLIDRQRLLYGDWKIKASAGTVFRGEWFQYVAVPPQGMQLVRYWDRAATAKKKNNDPDYTVGLLMGKYNGIHYVLDVKRFRGTPNDVESMIVTTAEQDRKLYGRVEIGIEVDPGSAGKFEANYYSKALSGHVVRLYPAINSKIKRSEPVSSQCQAGNVVIVSGGPWIPAFISELESFPDGPKDDQVDCFSGAFSALQNVGLMFGSNWK